MAAAESPRNQLEWPNAPCRNGAAITPSDDNDLAQVVEAVYIGATAGNLKFDTANGQTLTVPVTAYSSLSLWRIKKIYATGTTCANIWAAY